MKIDKSKLCEKDAKLVDHLEFKIETLEDLMNELKLEILRIIDPTPIKTEKEKVIETGRY